MCPFCFLRNFSSLANSAFFFSSRNFFCQYASTVADLINDKEASELSLYEKLVDLQSDYEDCKSALDNFKSNKKPDIRNIKNW